MRRLSLLPLSALSLLASAGAASAAPSNDLVSNGGFELGDTSSWTYAPSASSTFGVSGDANGGSFSGELFNDELATAAVISQGGLGVGTVSPGDVVTVSFAAKGVSAVGGVAFANFISINGSGGASGSTLLSGGPLPLDGNWQSFCFTTTAGSDVGGGVSLQFAAVTGAAAGSAMTLLVDDVKVTVQELTTNGGFELGDTSAWSSSPTANSTFAVSMDANTGSFAGEVFNDDPASAAIIAQQGLGIGSVSPGDVLQVSFAAKANNLVGGVAFANVISVDGMGGSSGSTLLNGGPLPVSGSWQTFDYTVTAGSDVTGGIVLQFIAVTGAASGSVSNLLIDDVTVTNTKGSVMSYCVSSPNVTGTGAVMGFSGSPSVANEDFVLEVSGLPPGEFYLFWVGQGMEYVPSFNGIICIGSPCRLFFPGQATAAGLGSKALPPSEYTFSGCTPPSVGTSYTYQCAYRDQIGVGVNWSDALCVTFGL